jgi:hypothetical protein
MQIHQSICLLLHELPKESESYILNSSSRQAKQRGHRASALCIRDRAKIQEN